jgi:YNFM family putative membrane transporter
MLIDRRQLAVFGGGFCAFTNLYPAQALLPTIVAEFEAGAAEAGLVVAASTISVALIAPFMGMVSDQLGRKRVITLSLAALTLITLLTALASSVPELVLWRFLAGLFVPGIFAVLVAYVREEWDAAGAVETTAFYVSGAVLGGFAGRFIAGLAADYWHWPAAFIALGLLDVLLLPMIMYWLPPSRHFQPGTGLLDGLRAMRRHLLNRRLQMAFAIGFGLLFSMVGVFTFVSLHLAQPPFGLSTGMIGSVFAVYLLGVVTTPIAGKLTRRHGRRPVALVSLTVAAGGLLLTLWPSLAAVVAGLALFSASMFVLQSVGTGFVPQAAVGGASAAVGLYVSSTFVGATLGSVLPARLWEAFGWPGCVLLIVTMQAIMALFSLRLWAPLPEQARPADYPAPP